MKLDDAPGCVPHYATSSAAAPRSAYVTPTVTTRDTRAPGPRPMRRGIEENGGVHHILPVDGHTQLTEPASLAMDVEGRISGQLRRHPGGDEGFAGSDGTVVNLNAAHVSHLQR